MTRHPAIRAIAILFTALFLLGQGLTQAHAAEFGESHEHDGVACTVSVLGENHAVTPVPLEVDTPVVCEEPEPVLSPTKAAAYPTAHPCRAPPPRAPPH